jgi:transposase InsO family protein
MHICIFWVGDGTFVSFGLRQRKKTLLKGMWEREKLEKKKTREMREREKKNQRRTCGGGKREKKVIFLKKVKSKNIILMR